MNYNCNNKKNQIEGLWLLSSILTQTLEKRKLK